LRDFGGELRFAYGRSYLEQERAISLDPRELPLAAGWFRPRIGEMPGIIRGASPKADNAALFRRMVFNIIIGNTDDHARNHSFFWDGRHYRLTPAYDICPMLRSGLTASQAMVVGTEGRLSTLRNALSEAPVFGLSPATAREEVDAMVGTVESEWPDAAEAAGLTRVQSDLLRRATVLSPGIFY